MPAFGPLRKPNLADELRLQPSATSHFSLREPLTPSAGAGFGQIHKRTFVPFENLKLLVELFQQSPSNPVPFFWDFTSFQTCKRGLRHVEKEWCPLRRQFCASLPLRPP